MEHSYMLIQQECVGCFVTLVCTQWFNPITLQHWQVLCQSCIQKHECMGGFVTLPLFGISAAFLFIFAHAYPLHTHPAPSIWSYLATMKVCHEPLYKVKGQLLKLPRNLSWVQPNTLSLPLPSLCSGIAPHQFLYFQILTHLMLDNMSSYSLLSSPHFLPLAGNLTPLVSAESYLQKCHYPWHLFTLFSQGT